MTRNLIALLAAAVPLLPMPAAVLAAQNAAPAATAGPSLPAYRILPGDQIEVYVWGEERLQRVGNVLPDGTIAVPLVGHIDAAGKLPSDLEAVIAAGLTKQYKGEPPQVTVSVRSPSGMQFSVAGKVRTPGTFTPGRYVNVLEAISIAGGPSEFADLSNVTILRKTGDRLTSLRIRLSDAMKGQPNQRDLASGGFPQVQAGDTVIVP